MTNTFGPVDTGYGMTNGHVFDSKFDWFEDLFKKVESPRDKELRVLRNEISDKEKAIKLREEKIKKLLARPAEPDGPTPVVFFVKRYGERDYNFSAIKGYDGGWFTTGATGPNGVTWDKLLDFIATSDRGDKALDHISLLYNPLRRIESTRFDAGEAYSLQTIQ